MSTLSHWFILVLTIINIAACLWLIMWSSAQGDPTLDDMDTLEHTWDGDLKERNNPLPRWWLYLFVGTVIWGFGYLAWYPGLGAFEGVSGWSQARQYEQERTRVDAVYQARFSELAQKDFAALAVDDDAMSVAGRLFADNCATCHGADGRGATGFPNLADSDWQWGGEPASIVHTITNGRQAAMPPWGASLGDDGVHEVTEYVKSLSARDHDAALANAGKARFAMFCVACHGVDGGGMAALGSPNLADDVWLYGRSDEAIATSIAAGRQGNMPAHGSLLSAEEIKLLAAYVMQLAPADEAG